MDDLENIRKYAIAEIKKKVKRNPKYLHPCNKERLADMKKLRFAYGNDFTHWMQKNGIMKNQANIDILKKEQNHIDSLTEKYGQDFINWVKNNKDKVPNKWINAGCRNEKEYRNFLARRLGFKDRNDQRKEWRHERGENLPLEFNEECSSWFGEFTENLMIHIYPCAIKMPYGNPGFDYLWNGIKINNKGRCLQYVRGGSPRFQFEIKNNNIAEKFILSGWDDRESLNPLIILEIDRNDMIRYGKGKNAPKIAFWKRYNFTLTYTPEGLDEFKNYQIDIDWLIDAKEKLG